MTRFPKIVTLGVALLSVASLAGDEHHGKTRRHHGEDGQEHVGGGVRQDLEVLCGVQGADSHDREGRRDGDALGQGRPEGRFEDHSSRCAFGPDRAVRPRPVHGEGRHEDGDVRPRDRAGFEVGPQVGSRLSRATD